jgi:hypothetical protein
MEICERPKFWLYPLRVRGFAGPPGAELRIMLLLHQVVSAVTPKFQENQGGSLLQWFPLGAVFWIQTGLAIPK